MDRPGAQCRHRMCAHRPVVADGRATRLLGERDAMTKHAAIGFVFVVSVAIGARTAAAQSPAGASGHWEGMIQTPGQPLAISVDLSAQPAGTWQGTITIPAQNVTGFALSAITVDGDSVAFSMKGVPGDPLFKGTLSKEPDRSRASSVREARRSPSPWHGRASRRSRRHRRARRSPRISKARGKER